MDDKKLIETIWNDMVLKKRFENNPYSLSCSEIELLRNQEKFEEIVNWEKLPLMQAFEQLILGRL